MIRAKDALRRLKEGNRRFADGELTTVSQSLPTRRKKLELDQQPFAVILGCSDSRVPAEIIFDQTLGDLFVIRVIGAIVTPSQAASIEFATAQLGAQLVVVLGHTSCGAIQATVDALQQPGAPCSKNLRYVVDQIRPAVEPLLGAHPDRKELVCNAVRANVRQSVQQLRDDRAIGPLVKERECFVVGAEYSLETGLVDFFDSCDD